MQLTEKLICYGSLQCSFNVAILSSENRKSYSICFYEFYLRNLTDNQYLFNAFKNITNELVIDNVKFDFRFSHNNKLFIPTNDFYPINVKKDCSQLVSMYKMIFSLHCKQIFPKDLVKAVKCINVHPGYNPINRGWYPQVFAIINKLPVGVTIHEIDEHLDHGMIIAREKVECFPWDTSLTIYNRLLDKEIDLLRRNIVSIINCQYKTFAPENEGNLYLKKDFEDLQ